jgi:hypothetical protein
MEIPMQDFRNLPYGAYLCENSIVYFDRRYRPLVRLTQPEWSAVVCDPGEWINYSGKEWLYDDATAPGHDAQTRARLRNLLNAIPALASEVRRRNTAEVSA